MESSWDDNWLVLIIVGIGRVVLGLFGLAIMTGIAYMLLSFFMLVWGIKLDGHEVYTHKVSNSQLVSFCEGPFACGNPTSAILPPNCIKVYKSELVPFFFYLQYEDC